MFSIYLSTLDEDGSDWVLILASDRQFPEDLRARSWTLFATFSESVRDVVRGARLAAAMDRRGYVVTDRPLATLIKGRAPSLALTPSVRDDGRS